MTTSKRKVVELFGYFRYAFQNLWTSQHPDKDTEKTAMRAWHHQLCQEGITDAEIDLGLNRLGQRSAERRPYPPSIFEFVDLCRPHREPYERQEFQGNELPQLPAEKDTAMSHLNQIKNKLRGVA